MRPTENQFSKRLTKLVDVRVVNLGPEKHLRWNHRVVFGQEEFGLEHTSFVNGLSGTRNLNEEVSAVAFRRLGVNANHRLLCKALSFLNFVRGDDLP